MALDPSDSAASQTRLSDQADSAAPDSGGVAIRATVGTGAVAPPRRVSRVWPIFSLYAGMVVWLLLSGAVVLLAAVASLDPDAFKSAEALTRATERVSQLPSVLLVSILLSVATSTFVALVYMRKGLEFPERPRWTRVRALPLVAATVAGLCLAQLVGALVQGTKLFGESASLKLISSAVTGASTIQYVLIVVGFVAAGVAEELFFRGAMQSRLNTRWGAAPAIWITSALFGLLHFDLVHSVFAGAFGVYLGWLVVRSRSMVPAVTVHATNNLVAGVASRFVTAETEIAMPVVGAYLLVGGAALALVLRSWPRELTSDPR